MGTPKASLDAWDVQHEWDQRYLDAGLHPWGLDPNATVVEVVSVLARPASGRPGDALDLGAGDGRNALWLAEHGWRVTAVDISPIALAELREHAWGRGWDLVTIHADLRAWSPPPASADLVLLAFVQLGQRFRGRLHRAAAAAVRPGGTLVLVAHDRSNLEHGVGGPQDPGRLPSREEVVGDLAGLAIDRAEVIDRPVEGAPRPARDLLVVAHRPDEGA